MVGARSGNRLVRVPVPSLPFVPRPDAAPTYPGWREGFEIHVNLTLTTELLLRFASVITEIADDDHFIGHIPARTSGSSTPSRARKDTSERLRRGMPSTSMHCPCLSFRTFRMGAVSATKTMRRLRTRVSPSTSFTSANTVSPSGISCVGSSRNRIRNLTADASSSVSSCGTASQRFVQHARHVS